MPARAWLLTASLLIAMLPVGSAGAWPNLGIVPEAEVALIHHKPWHKGGPPWARQRSPGNHYGWETRRYESQRWYYQRVPDRTDLPRARDTFRFGD